MRIFRFASQVFKDADPQVDVSEYITNGSTCSTDLWLCNSFDQAIMDQTKKVNFIPTFNIFISLGRNENIRLA